MTSTAPSISGYGELIRIFLGGSSVIYSGLDEANNQLVAIKVLTSLSIDESLDRSLRRELQALERLSGHPYVISVLDSGLTENQEPYIVMPLYTNGSYAQRIEVEGPISWVETVDVGIKIADALQMAHDRNVLHRDIKPSNIFVGEYRTDPVLADFGIATFLEDDKTTTKALAYTLKYVAPEILADQRQTHLADIYSLGATLRQFLTGRPPFEANHPAALVNLITNKPPTPLLLELPAALAELLDRMMAKDPLMRPQSCTIVTDVLRAVQQDRPQITEPVVPLRPVPKTPLPAIAEMPTERIGQVAPLQRRVQNQLRLVGHDETVNSLTFSNDGSMLATASDDKTIILWDIPNVRTETTQPTNNNRTHFDDTERPKKDGDTQIGPIKTILRGHTDWVNTVAFSQDNKMLATGGDDHQIILWDAQTGEQTLILAGHTSNVNAVAFSPDNQTLASASADGSVILWNAQTGHIQQSLGDSLDLNSVHTLAYRPDGFAIATGSFDGTVILWDAETGLKQQIIEDHTDWVTQVLFSPNSSMLATSSFDGTAIIRDSLTGEKLHVFSSHSDWVTDIAFSPDSSMLVSIGIDDKVLFWNTTSGQSDYTISGFSELVSRLALHPMGALLATTGADRHASLWTIEPPLSRVQAS